MTAADWTILLVVLASVGEAAAAGSVAAARRGWPNPRPIHRGVQEAYRTQTGCLTRRSAGGKWYDRSGLDHSAGDPGVGRASGGCRLFSGSIRDCRVDCRIFGS